ncbi:SulP family inorganic anion transporter [Protaetiibacter mangrovi]|uniref:SulP family inorganic anion transporter n=1 Tax=Protaetiibacter mangrovi TaxID=2970926 RepID=A0ABT1ZDT9_9MICO|nr:SulP family inorganic anion transporter [Protaetiibacter mangrovi]MCS0498867.1 SulP family inorganic anion transporter [Protaetiibacter mangrovi]TPX02717.1 SulP family inorganic anion transporter [Schumannella luteola]
MAAATPPSGIAAVRGRVASAFSRRTLGKDVVAGVVLGVESVPDGLASGLLAGVNPIAGLYAYLFGMVGAAFVTSSAFLAVQATGAMALVVADAGLASRPDPEAALFTLSMIAGVLLVVGGLLRVGTLVRFAPTAVMTGFLTAVGVNIVLGQLSNFTGYDARGDNRVIRTVDTMLHVADWKPSTVFVGVLTVLLIVLFAQTPVGSLGLVIAVVVGSLVAWAVDLGPLAHVATIGDLVTVPHGLPAPVLPSWGDIAYLVVPAFSLAFVCIVQGAGVSAGLPTPDGRTPNASRDIVGQGVGNIVAGVFQGMPVGGSMSASSLVIQAGGRTRLALFVAGAVMALVVLVASPLVSFTAMPALAGLLIVVGVTSIKPTRVMSVIKTGPLQTTVMAVTFVLTLLIPLQFAELVGVGLGIILFVAQQSNRVRVREVELTDDGRMREVGPRPHVGAGEIVVLQPYGSLFFASAPTFETQLPKVDASSRNSVVIVRLRGTDQIGLAHIEVLRRYAARLREAGSTLKVVASEQRVITQLRATQLAAELGRGNIYRGSEWVGAAVLRAHRDARAEIAARS